MNSDFRELLRCLDEAGAKYLIVGGYAVIEYTEPRYTKDLDLLIGTDLENASAVYRALARFGAPLADVQPIDLTEPDIFLQIGVAPVRVDVLTTIPGIDFADAWERRSMRAIEDISAPFISRDDLIAAKVASGRRQDIADARSLKRARDIESGSS